MRIALNPSRLIVMSPPTLNCPAAAAEGLADIVRSPCAREVPAVSNIVNTV
jgi:hypothetical protein